MNLTANRLISAVFTMFLVSVLCFLIFGVIKGDPSSYTAGVNATEEQRIMLRHEMGLDNNIFVRYTQWLSGFFTGKKLYSLRYSGENISEMILKRIPVSSSLALMSLIFILLISIPVSLLTVRHTQNNFYLFIDKTINFLTAAGLSIPGFFLGLLFIWIFGLTAKLFTPGLYIDYSQNFFRFTGCLIFPALTIAIPNSAVLIKFLRGSLYQELQSDYVRTAKSKGAGSRYILIRHVLKNASIPALTIFGMIIAEVFSGVIIIEQVFTIPGIGRLLIGAVLSRDYPLIQSLVVYFSFIVVFANALADIIIFNIDPRIIKENYNVKK